MSPAEMRIQRARVVVYGREPVLGETKTRLARAVGSEAACAIYEAMLAHALLEARESDLESLLSLAAPLGSDWRPPLDVACEEQVAGDLGVRMRASFDASFEAGCDAVVLIGSDIPGCTRRHGPRAPPWRPRGRGCGSWGSSTRSSRPCTTSTPRPICGCCCRTHGSRLVCRWRCGLRWRARASLPSGRIARRYRRRQMGEAPWPASCVSAVAFVPGAGARRRRAGSRSWA